MSDLNVIKCSLKEISITDEFFDSLKKDYYKFDKWYLKKVKLNYYAYSSLYDGKLVGLMILKKEKKSKPILKISTFKVSRNNCGIGITFLDIATKYAREKNLNYMYITIFKKYKHAISYFKRHGFIEYGYKSTKMGNGNMGCEMILVKFLDK